MLRDGKGGGQELVCASVCLWAEFLMSLVILLLVRSPSSHPTDSQGH